MVYTWLDYVIAGIVIFAAFAIFYKGLKEPIDSIGRLLKKLFGSMGEKISNSQERVEVIRYG